MTTQYPVLVLCGSDQKRRQLLEELDPDQKYTSKALLPFVGKRVIDWQLEALYASPFVKDIYLLGLNDQEIEFEVPVHLVPITPTSSQLEKLEAGLAYLENQGENPATVIISTSDTPGITTTSINQFFEAVQEHPEADVIICGVSLGPTEELFPNHGRVVGHLKEDDLYPGEMFALTPRAIRDGKMVIQELSARRRKFNRQAKNVSLGPLIRYIARKPYLWGMILKYLTGQLSLLDAERSLSKAFKLNVKAVVITDPGFGMDMDLPEDFQRLEEYVLKTKNSERLRT